MRAADLHVVAELVRALMHIIRGRTRQHRGVKAMPRSDDAEGGRVARERKVPVVREQHPVAFGGEAEDRARGRELSRYGFFGLYQVELPRPRICVRMLKDHSGWSRPP